MIKRLLISALLFTLVSFGVAACSPTTQDTEQNTDSTAETLPVVEDIAGVSQPNEPPFTYQYSAQLSDVTDGKVLPGNVDTQGQAVGTAQAGFNGQRYQLTATINNLPQPEDGFFYEGWIVRGEAESVISTGELIQEIPGTYSNMFINDDDLSDHTRYVLTIEPDDGDPAPADHVVDGVLETNT